MSKSSTRDQLVFADPTGTYQLTIGAMNYRSEASRQDFEQILKDRRRAETQVAPDARVEFGQISTYGSGFGCEFLGADDKSNRRFAGRLLMAKGLILTSYLEGLNKTDLDFKKTKAAVLAGVSIAGVH